MNVFWWSIATAATMSTLMVNSRTIGGWFDFIFKRRRPKNVVLDFDPREPLETRFK